MKKIKILFALLFFVNFCFSQVPAGAQIVTDPSNNVQLVKTVENTLQTLKISKENLEIVKKGLETAKKVNNALQSSKITVQITDNLKIIYENMSDLPNLMDDIKNPTIRKNLIKNSNDLFIDIEVFQELSASVLTDNILSMSDSERLEMLLNIYDRSKILVDKSDRLIKIIKASK